MTLSSISRTISRPPLRSIEDHITHSSVSIKRATPFFSWSFHADEWKDWIKWTVVRDSEIAGDELVHVINTPIFDMRSIFCCSIKWKLGKITTLGLGCRCERKRQDAYRDQLHNCWWCRSIDVTCREQKTREYSEMENLNTSTALKSKITAWQFWLIAFLISSSVNKRLSPFDRQIRIYYLLANRVQTGAL